MRALRLAIEKNYLMREKMKGLSKMKMMISVLEVIMGKSTMDGEILHLE